MNHLTYLERLLYAEDKDIINWYKDNTQAVELSEFEHYRVMRDKMTRDIRDKIITTIEFLIILND